MRLIDEVTFNLERYTMTDKKHKTEARFLERLERSRTCPIWW
jgi:hypothetical protein